LIEKGSSELQSRGRRIERVFVSFPRVPRPCSLASDAQLDFPTGKKDSSFSEEKEAKRLLCPGARDNPPGSC
jgi:hypothetical protein